MVIIKTTCPSCRQNQVLGPDDLYLEVADHEEWGEYFFRCFSCDEYVGVVVGKVSLLLLMDLGVKWNPIIYPSPPITKEEARIFAKDLKWIEDFVEEELLN